MILFIDKTTGNTYNGNKPYTHWFEGKQSVGLYYDKQFIVLTDKSDITVSLDSEAFYLVDENALNIETIRVDEKSYLDVKKITAKQLHLTNGIRYAGSDGAIYNIFSFSVIASGLYVGQITDVFTINDEEFAIGADFVDENEMLSVNLSNFGQEMHKDVQRAIYEKDIHEQLPDYVLLNRKYKELLNEYINVIGNKGSYKSLLNSLKWFEYGDLVKIYEYWRHNEPNKEYLNKKDLEQFVTEAIENMLSVYQKTTYISINYALDRIAKENGQSTFQTLPAYSNGNKKLVPEPVPELEQTLSLWSQSEMSLKMVLLGNFFATYFMPIHLDLIHCTIENLVYTTCVKILHGTAFNRVDYSLDVNEFYCEVKDVHHISNVETFTNIHTPFGFLHESVKEFTDEEDGSLEQLGVDLALDETQDQETQLITYALQHYKGLGVVVPFECKLYNVSNGKHITSGYIRVYKNGILVKERETTNVGDRSTYITNSIAHINFNILLREVGNYKVQLAFTRNDGHTYIKVVDFVVDEICNQEIELYKVVPKYESIPSIPTIDKWITDSNNDSAIDISDIAKYTQNTVMHDSKHYYTQFIPANNDVSNSWQSVYLNHVMILRFKSDLQINDVLKHLDVVIQKYSNGKFTPKGKSILLNRLKKDIETGYNTWLNSYKDTLYGIKSKFIPSYNMLFVQRASALSHETADDKIAIFENTSYNYIMIVDAEPLRENRIVYSLSTDSPQILTIYNRTAFIPYLYKLEKVGVTKVIDELNGITEEEKFKKLIDSSTYHINADDLICFRATLPETKKPSVLNWKFTCETTNAEIIPISYSGTGDNIPTILQPFFGRFDLAKVPDYGYYTIMCNYKMDEEQEKDNTVEICSSFIYDK